MRCERSLCVIDGVFDASLFRLKTIFFIFFFIHFSRCSACIVPHVWGFIVNKYVVYKLIKSYKFISVIMRKLYFDVFKFTGWLFLMAISRFCVAKGKKLLCHYVVYLFQGIFEVTRP
jgi:hypothetical protein